MIHNDYALDYNMTLAWRQGGIKLLLSSMSVLRQCPDFFKKTNKL